MFSALLLSGFLTFVELNCENLFNTVHDSLKQDYEFLPDGSHRWTRTRYWRKLNAISKELISLGEQNGTWRPPALAVLCEVENDSVLFDLTRRSLLRSAGYQYVITESPDERGIDVALLYDPFVFRLLYSRSIRVPLQKGMSPTRDILYAKGIVSGADTLHVFCVHAPSRRGGERASRPRRMHVARLLTSAIDSIYKCNSAAMVFIAGDFNDHSSSPAVRYISSRGLVNISSSATGRHGARATYRFRGLWESLDQMFCSPSLASRLVECYIGDEPYLLEADEKYGGVKPRRTYLGPRYLGGYSDHLPLVSVFEF